MKGKLLFIPAAILISCCTALQPASGDDSRDKVESQRKVLIEEPASEAKGTVHSAEKKHDHRNWNRSLPDGLRERLASLKGRLAVPSNASVQEFADRYEVTAAPWHTFTTHPIITAEQIPSHAHRGFDAQKADHKDDDHSNDADRKDEHSDDADHKHDHAHDADHKHEHTQTEHFADEGKLTVHKAEKGAITRELVGNAWFESDYLHFSAQRIVYHLGGSNARMTLIGNARLVNDDKKVRMTADRITNKAEWTLLEGNARLIRKAAAGKSEIISADRLELNTAANTIKVD